MSRQKYDYDHFILQSSYRAGSSEYLAAEKKADADMDEWITWTGGSITHNTDGSYTQELTNWLKANEKQIEIMGYGMVGEQINIWNPQVKSWEIDRHGDFVFSSAYWEYLLSEGYVKRWIQCHEHQLAVEFGALSCSFPDEWIEQRIRSTEIPNPSRYDPIDGMLSERRIYDLQEQANENPMRENRVLAGITWKGVRGL